MVVAEEVMGYLKETGNEGLLLKVDFKKTFDTLDWAFLLDSLQARDWSDRLIGWIRECLRSSHAAVLLNNELGRFFKIKRGLKEGGPPFTNPV